MAASAAYASTPKTWPGQVTAANPNRDGTGTLVTIATGGTNGSRIDFITIKATVSTTDGMVRLFLDDGSSTRLLHEEPVAGVTVAANVPAYAVTVPFVAPILLPGATWTLKAATEKGEAINIFAIGGDF